MLVIRRCSGLALLAVAVAALAWGGVTAPTQAKCYADSVGVGSSCEQLPMSGTGGQNAVTVTNSSASLLAARTAPQAALSVKNESTTASIAICFGSSCTAALNTAGSITIGPGLLWSASPGYVPLDQIKGISSAATSPATIQAN